MPVPIPRSRGVMLLLAFAASLLLASAFTAGAMADTGGARGAVYTQTNDPNGNTVQRFARAADGGLSPAGSFPTGGAGLATLGGRQGAVALSGDGRSLYAVNAGSDSVSVFRVGHRGARLLDIVRRVASRRPASPKTTGASTCSIRAARRTSSRSGAGSTGRSSRFPAVRVTSLPAPRAPRRSPSRPTVARSSSASASPTASRRSRSTASAARARPS